MQQGRLIVLIGHARAKNGSNSKWLGETGAGAKFRHSIPAEPTTLPGVAENVEFKLPAGLNDPRAA